MPPLKSQAHRRALLSPQRGISLIEVLVSIVILAIGLLGLAGLQTASVTFNHSAYNRSQASILAMDIADRIRANTAAANNYITPGAPLENVNCLALAGCSAIQMAQHDLFEWNAALSNTLPNGRGTVTVNGAVYTATVFWDDDRDNDNTNDISFQVTFRP